MYGKLGDEQCRDFGGMDARGNAYHVPRFKLPNIFNSSNPNISHSEVGARQRGMSVAYNTYDIDGYILYRVENGSTAPPSCIVSAGMNPEDAAWSSAATSYSSEECLPGPEHYQPSPFDGEPIPMEEASHVHSPLRNERAYTDMQQQYM